jgi:hypothetical protein
MKQTDLHISLQSLGLSGRLRNLKQSLEKAAVPDGCEVFHVDDVASRIVASRSSSILA